MKKTIQRFTIRWFMARCTYFYIVSCIVVVVWPVTRAETKGM